MHTEKCSHGNILSKSWEWSMRFLFTKCREVQAFVTAEFDAIVVNPAEFLSHIIIEIDWQSISI